MKRKEKEKEKEISKVKKQQILHSKIYPVFKYPVKKNTFFGITFQTSTHDIIVVFTQPTR